jgi:four helix bundle protein
MSKLPFAKSFKDLIVYQKSRQLSKQVFRLTVGFPKEETFSLTDQVRRSSRSIGAQISEAWAKRLYPKHFASKLTDAQGETNETEHWIMTAVDCGYINTETASHLINQLEEIGRMLQRMIERAEDFQGDDHKRVRESSPNYGDLHEFFLPDEDE